MARSSECMEQYAQKVLDRSVHCQRRDITTVVKSSFSNALGLYAHFLEGGGSDWLDLLKSQTFSQSA
jgi:hypothetical protein